MRANEFLVFDESFDSNVPITWVKDNNNSTTGTFTVNNQSYMLNVEYGNYTRDNMQINFANISFSMVDENGDPSYDLTGLNKGMSTIFSTVMRGVTEVVSKESLHALVFGATNNTERRMNLYNLIASRFAKSFGTLISDKKTPNGVVTICVNRKVFPDNTSYNNFVEYIRTTSLIK